MVSSAVFTWPMLQVRVLHPPPTGESRHFDQLAQLVERSHYKRGVVGASPTLVTNDKIGADTINFDEEESALSYDNFLMTMFVAMTVIVMLLSPFIKESAVVYWWAATWAFATIGSHFG